MQAPSDAPKNEMRFSNLALMHGRFHGHVEPQGMRVVVHSEDDIAAVEAGAKKNPDVLTQMTFRAKGEDVRRKMAALLEAAPNKGAAQLVYNIGKSAEGHIVRTQDHGIWRGKLDARGQLEGTEDVKATPPKKLLQSVLGIVEREAVNLKIHSVDGWGSEECALLRSIVTASKKGGHALRLGAAKKELLPVLEHILKTGALPTTEPDVVELEHAPVELVPANSHATNGKIMEPARCPKKREWFPWVRKLLSRKQ